MRQRGSRILAKVDALRRQSAVPASIFAALTGFRGSRPFPTMTADYCGGLTPSLVICTRVAVNLPPASVELVHRTGPSEEVLVRPCVTVDTRNRFLFLHNWARSFDSYTGVLDDAGPCRAVGLNQGRELFGRAADNLSALHGEFFLHLCGAQAPAHLIAEPYDDLARRTCRSEQAVPGTQLVPGNAGFVHRGHPGELGRTVLARHGENPQLARLEGAALATKSVPMLPPAPGRFSTRNGCSQVSVSFWATRRTMMSFGPPGANGTTMRTGREG